MLGGPGGAVSDLNQALLQYQWAQLEALPNLICIKPGTKDWRQSQSSLFCDSHDHRFTGPVAAVRYTRAAIYLLPPGRPLRRSLHGRRPGASALPSAHRPRCGDVAAVALCARTVLRIAVLLLRLQQDHHEEARERRCPPAGTRARGGALQRAARTSS